MKRKTATQLENEALKLLGKDLDSHIKGLELWEQAKALRAIDYTNMGK